MTYQEDEEQPLDPVMERVRKKMIRLMVISIGIMMIGLMAVLFAIVFKISGGSQDDGDIAATETDQAVVQSSLDFPVGSTIVWSAVDSGRLIIQVKHLDRSTEFYLVDTKTGKLASRIKAR